MRKILLPIVAGLVLGGAVHLISILAMPRLAQNDAFARLSRLGDVNRVVQIPDPTPFEATLPRMDPATVSTACVYDLSRGPLQVRVPTTPDLTSVAFFTREGRFFYALNDRAANRRAVELQLMTGPQRAALPQDEEITAADRLIVESPTERGIVIIRAFVREPGAKEAIRKLLEGARCAPMI